MELWKLVEAQAKREQISLNAELQQAARIWLMAFAALQRRRQGRQLRL